MSKNYKGKAKQAKTIRKWMFTAFEQAGGIHRYVELMKRDPKAFITHVDRLVKLEPKELHHEHEGNIIHYLTNTPRPTHLEDNIQEVKTIEIIQDEDES